MSASDNPGNLPANVPDDDEIRRRHLAALAESTLRFRRSATDTMDELLIQMIGQQCEVGWNKFKTPQGRPCILILGVGEDAVGPLTDAVYYLTHPEENREEPKEPRE